MSLDYQFSPVLLEFSAKVHKQFFWMMKLGSPSPKRSGLWSSSRAIHEFKAYAKLSKKEKGDGQQLARSYRDGSGKLRYTGVKKNLKKSQSLLSIYTSFKVCMQLNGCTLASYNLRKYPFGFALRFAKLWPRFRATPVEWRIQQVQASGTKPRLHAIGII